MRKWQPDIDPASIPDQVLKSEWGRRSNAKRTVFSGGPKPKPKCACGKMTLDRAQKRNHHCV